MRLWLFFSISLSISFEIFSSVILAYPCVVKMFERPVILVVSRPRTHAEPGGRTGHLACPHHSDFPYLVLNGISSMRG
ncbi:hypothetical protein EVA_18771 [gut metagenome]|uniref:Uncharacterized protein n=1 Tax=gut metagenome TaxID=749906 RepID=J9G0N5_9ZZZZ